MHLTKSRLEGLTDGIFAFAMTLLVIGLNLPDKATLVQSTEFATNFLFSLYSDFFHYVLAFLILGAFWLIHHVELHPVQRMNRMFVWLNLGISSVCCHASLLHLIFGRFPRCTARGDRLRAQPLCNRNGDVPAMEVCHRKRPSGGNGNGPRVRPPGRRPNHGSSVGLTRRGAYRPGGDHVEHDSIPGHTVCPVYRHPHGKRGKTVTLNRNASGKYGDQGKGDQASFPQRPSDHRDSSDLSAAWSSPLDSCAERSSLSPADKSDEKSGKN